MSDRVVNGNNCKAPISKEIVAKIVHTLYTTVRNNWKSLSNYHPM